MTRRRPHRRARSVAARFVVVLLLASALAVASGSGTAGAAPPIGNVDTVGYANGQVVVQGWSAWPTVHIYVDGQGLAAAPTGGSRPDVAAALGWGPDTGFRTAAPYSTPGTHTVCVYAINPDEGPNQTLGCLGFSVAVTGNLELVDRPDPAQPGRLRIAGWATTRDVHFYLNGRGLAATQTDRPRSDVDAIFGDPEAGFQHFVDAGAGGTLCAYAVDGLVNPLIGCLPVAATTRVVTEALGVPFAAAGGVTLVHPADRVELIGFHESTHDGAQQLDAVSTAAPSATMASRNRDTGSRTAADLAVHPAATIRSPVSGTVIAAGTYVLYCQYSDDYVFIEPDARPGWQVKVLHVDGVTVTAGTRVEAGRTVLAPRATQLPFRSQVDWLTAEPSWPHVHVEIVDPSVPDRPTGPGC